MPKTRRTYEKPSRISQGLVICFSIAVVVMAGWFAMTVMFSHDARSRVAEGVAIETASIPLHAENVAPEPERAGETVRLNSAYFEPIPRDYAPNIAPPPRLALPLASLTAPPPAAVRDPEYFPLSTATPSANYRGILSDEPLQAEIPVGASDVLPDLVPLPPPKPRRTASIPVPRPRPRLDGDDMLLDPEHSIFDALFNRQR